jgi:hypothetical protein
MTPEDSEKRGIGMASLISILFEGGNLCRLLLHKFLAYGYYRVECRMILQSVSFSSIW